MSDTDDRLEVLGTAEAPDGWCHGSNLDLGELWSRPGQHRRSHAEHVPAPRIELPGADPVLAREFRRVSSGQ